MPGALLFWQTVGCRVPASGCLRERRSFFGKRELAGELFLFGRRQSAGCSFLFVPEKEAKRARRSDAAAAGWGCGPRPQDAAT